MQKARTVTYTKAMAIPQSIVEIKPTVIKRAYPKCSVSPRRTYETPHRMRPRKWARFWPIL